MAGIPRWLCTLQTHPPPSIGHGTLISMRESDRLSRHPRAHNTQWQLLALAWMLELTPFSWVLAISASTPTFCHSCDHSMQTDPTMIDRLGNVRLVRNTIIFSDRVCFHRRTVMISYTWTLRPKPQCVGTRYCSTVYGMARVTLSRGRLYDV